MRPGRREWQTGRAKKRRGRHDADAEASLLSAPGAPGRFECAIVLRQQRARMFEKPAPRFGQLDAARLSAQEHDIELALDRLDPLAQWRLLHTEPLGRAGDVSFLGHGDEMPQMPEPPAQS